MKAVVPNRLIHRRQYIISPDRLECPFEHTSFHLAGSYRVYTHVDLPVAIQEVGNSRIILLGDMFDFEFPEKGNRDILMDLLECEYSQFLQKTARYTGRYVLIHVHDHQVHIITDATAARKVYYSIKGQQLWIASQSFLLAKVLGLDETRDQSKLKFYHSDDFKRLDHANVCNTTRYDEVFQLIPNHYLRLDNFRVQRFWPDCRIEMRPLKEVASKCAKIVRGYMKAINLRYKVMLPVTAGYDSRLLLAGTKEFAHSIYYYINRSSGMNDTHRDIRIPAALFNKLGLEYHIEELDHEVDEEFRRIYFENNPFAGTKYLPHVYNYYKKFGERVNLPANFASSTWGINRLSEKSISAKNLAILYNLEEYNFIIACIQKWLDDCQDVCRKFNFEIIRLFYWEERLGNWGTNIQLDKDIAQEDINPLNSRLLLTKFSSVKRRHNNMPRKLLHRRIIRIMWPELLKVPLNPSSRYYALLLLGALNLIPYAYHFKHQFLLRFRYRRIQSKQEVKH